MVLVTRDGYAIRFADDQVRPMGRASQGVRGIRLDDDDRVVAAAVAEEEGEVLLLTSRGYGKRTRMSEFRRQRRGGGGVRAMKLTRVRGRLVDALSVRPDDEVFIVSTDGNVIRQAVKEISRQKRDSSGVRVINLGEGAELSSVAKVPAHDR